MIVRHAGRAEAGNMIETHKTTHSSRYHALSNSKGSDNVALGAIAGEMLSSGNGNVYLGAGIMGVFPDDNTTRISDISHRLELGLGLSLGS